MRQVSRPNPASVLSVALGETEPRFDLGDLGPAYGHAMRRRAI
jgi:hypothetical protein